MPKDARDVIEAVESQRYTDTLLARTVLPFIPRRITPNEVTWMRIAFLPFIVYFLLVHNYGVGFALFAIAAITDALDGAMARTRHEVTDLGNLLDALADWGLIGIAAVMLLPMYFGWWLVAALFAFELFSIAMAYRSYRRTGSRPEHNWAGKLKMIMQCVAFCFMLGTLFFGESFWLLPALALFLASLPLSLLEVYLYPQYPPKAHAKKITVDGLKVEYREEGSGPTLLLLHGWMSSLITFDALVERLKDHFRVVRIDLPGFGDSEQPHTSWRLVDYAKFVKAFLRQTGIEPAAIVGHSFGGRIILKGTGQEVFAAPKLVLIDAEAGEQLDTLRPRLYKAAAKTGKALGAHISRELTTQLRRLFVRRDGSEYLDTAALSETFLNTAGEDLIDEARRISVPVLLLWGARDKMTPLADAKRLAGAIRNSKLVVFPHAGHVPYQKFPKEVADAIRAFV
ncbi:MAG: alpha/beta fold hydrolase [Patescibacteria group bacterium]|nr:alpha/beta fold hydrolase [Patescibacteria group bacterium]